MSIRWDERNQRWRFEFDKVIKGKRHRVSRLLPKGRSKAEAQRYDVKETGRLFDLASGHAPKDELIDRAVVLYLTDKRSMKSHRSAVQHLHEISPFYAGRMLSELAEVAAEIAEDRQGARDGVVLSDATVRNRLALLKAACRWAWKRHALCDHDPTGRMQMPSVRNERQVYASRAQMLAIARAADRRDVRRLVLVAFYSGMRLGEIMRAVPAAGALTLLDTKNGDRRTVPVHPRAQHLLKHFPFTAPKITLQRGFERARRAVGLTHIRIHDLRHSAASEMINAGVDLYTVGKVLGHRDARSTARYSHISTDTLAEAVAKIGRQKSPHKAKKKAA